QIERIAKKPCAQLVVVKYHRDSVSRGKPITFSQYVDSFEPRLVAFARRKLGKRVTFLYCHPGDVGAKVASIFDPAVKVNLYGEYNNACVEATHYNLVHHGFKVAVHKEKGVGV
ncbi:MAG: hypothetical protein V1644_01685, partial [Candidatus Micrarchaeota archaeon]